jgi:hypothetical protein
MILAIHLLVDLILYVNQMEIIQCVPALIIILVYLQIVVQSALSILIVQVIRLALEKNVKTHVLALVA